MRKPTTPSILDVLDETSLQLDENLNALDADYQNWQKADGRGNKKLWSLLSRVYELGAVIEKNTSARSRLIHKVNQHPTVQGSNRWRADKKSSQELLLALLLGVREETKATKSQWLGAIRAAQKADVPAKDNAFETWLDSVGGINAARMSIRTKFSSKYADLKSLIEELDGFIDSDQQPCRMPEPISDSGYPENIGLVIVQRVGDQIDGIPIATLTDEKLITKAIRIFLADATRAQRQLKRQMDTFERRRLREAKPNWTRYVKSEDYYGTLEEYIRDGCPEF